MLAFVAERGVRMRRANFAQQFLRPEAAPQRAGHQVLDENVEGCLQRDAGLDAPLPCRFAGGRSTWSTGA
jgi:hypothetical protein